MHIIAKFNFWCAFISFFCPPASGVECWHLFKTITSTFCTVVRYGFIGVTKRIKNLSCITKFNFWCSFISFFCPPASGVEYWHVFKTNTSLFCTVVQFCLIGVAKTQNQITKLFFGHDKSLQNVIIFFVLKSKTK